MRNRSENNRQSWASKANERELIERLEASLARMPRRTRDIFLANRLRGLSYDEIAEGSGLSVRQVERHMARAIAMIDRFMDGEERPRWKPW